jgi:hypothetical protein
MAGLIGFGQMRDAANKTLEELGLGLLPVLTIQSDACVIDAIISISISIDKVLAPRHMMQTPVIRTEPVGMHCQAQLVAHTLPAFHHVAFAWNSTGVGACDLQRGGAASGQPQCDRPPWVGS